MYLFIYFLCIRDNKADTSRGVVLARVLRSLDSIYYEELQLNTEDEEIIEENFWISINSPVMIHPEQYLNVQSIYYFLLNSRLHISLKITHVNFMVAKENTLKIIIVHHLLRNKRLYKVSWLSIHLIVEISQSEPKWLADRQTEITVHKATGLQPGCCSGILQLYVSLTYCELRPACGLWSDWEEVWGVCYTTPSVFLLYIVIAQTGCINRYGEHCWQ